jgi:hypothetical protein
MAASPFYKLRAGRVRPNLGESSFPVKAVFFSPQRTQRNAEEGLILGGRSG